MTDTAKPVWCNAHASTYSSNYDRSSLEKCAERARQWLREGRAVHVYFDNDALGYAPWNALTLMEMLGLARPVHDKAQFNPKRRARGEITGEG